MCSSAPKVKPIPSAPDVGPSVIDDAAVNERDRELKRNRARSGRQSTILAGNEPAAPTASVKTATGQ